MPEGEEAGQKCVRVNGAAKLLPILKSLSRQISKIERFAPREAACAIAVCVVMYLLQLDESRSNMSERPSDRLEIKAGREFRRYRILGGRDRDVLHGNVMKGLRQAVAQ